MGREGLTHSLRPAAQLCVWVQGGLFVAGLPQGCTEVQRELTACLPGRLPTHRDLDDLVEHDVRSDVEVEDEVLEGGRTQAGRHQVGSSHSGAVLGPSPLAVPVCTPAVSPEPPSSGEQQWQPLVLPDLGQVGGKTPTPRQGRCHLMPHRHRHSAPRPHS